jgi:very-short-patch-repair endonuclease
MRFAFVCTFRPLPLGEGRGGFDENVLNFYIVLPNTQSGSIASLKRLRHYRGGYQIAGFLDQARQLRARQTAAEELLWQLLRNRQLLGFKFRRQHQFGDYVADFYCREGQLVIECDGTAHEPNEQWQHDRERDAYMLAQGLRILRFRNEQVLDDIESVLMEIAKHLQSG